MVCSVVLSLGGWLMCGSFFLFQAEDGIRDLVRSRGLGDVYKRQGMGATCAANAVDVIASLHRHIVVHDMRNALDVNATRSNCLLYTSDAADERSSVDLGGRRIIKKKNRRKQRETAIPRQ